MDELNTNYLYLIIFAILIGETDIEVNLQSIFQDLIQNNAALAYNLFVTTLLGIAATKAILIAAYYQHLRYEPRSLSVWVILGIIIASILMSLTFVQLSYHSFHTA
ncbi:MAG TPA: cytochrome C oxidase subunit IV family protein [Candidatus Dormibacteraeota bacterium]|nr:cytochrome C oxidase subunit IV family protein [Candidatus Dormibacteraeota bacterium]